MMLRPLPFAASLVALFALGCSDAPARPAKLGITVKLENPSPAVSATRTCRDQNTWDIGRAVKMNGQVIDVEAPTPDDVGTTLEDGKSGASITCTVRKNGAFNADGGGTDPQREQPQGLMNFTMSGTATDGATNVAFSVFTPLNQQLEKNQGDPSCTLTTVHKKDLGALWASFDCPLITRVGTPGDGCHASGTVVFEYCKTGEEEN